MNAVAPDAWGIGDIAEHMQVSRVTVAKWRAHPSFPPAGYVNARGTMIFDPDQVIRWAVDNAGLARVRDRAQRLHRQRSSQ